ncbi:MAG: hypothetical protein Athens101428_427 [Candidatus Berkelbacteria bacterium Athens1014_28]|uniref:Uncharacterized protein n=1 Tax=Candidatus Berkelbacteria bacterium Athens1014_28 TaxID=2017145 RepID=A0A554LMJ7_9BACT|nr:MAG: hypothetical protein Athens101428_427 [Candidatus Berkelbacteria bacterium Athens1014_28]
MFFLKNFGLKAFFSFIFIFFAVAIIFSAPRAKAASFDLIQTPGDGRVFMKENFAKRHIKDFNTFLSWGFNTSMIRQVSRAEFDATPTAPQLTTVMNYNGNVYAIICGMKAHVASGEALVLNGFSWSDMQTFADPTFGMLPTAAPLTSSGVRAVHIPSEGRVYYIENGYRRWIPNSATWNDWKPFTGNFINSEGAKSLPLAPPVSRVLNYNGAVYVIVNGGKAYVPSGEALVLNNFSWSEMQTFADPTFGQMQTWTPLQSPRIIACGGGIYLAKGGKKHHIETWDAYINLGTQYVNVSSTACNSLPNGSGFGRLIQGPNGQVFWLEGNTRRYIPDPGTFSGYNFRVSDVRQVEQSVIDDVGPGSDMARWVSSLSGISIASTSGRTGKEQHLWTTSGENSDAGHYNLTGVPATGPYGGINLQNGVAGTGAFGKLDAGIEKWYITMRWGYCEWYEDFGIRDGDYPSTQTRNLNSGLKSWHLGKKVIVSNPANGRKIVAAVGESGPAIWVTNARGVTSGLSPEATDYIVGAAYGLGGNVLEYGWAVDQNLPLGPLNW